MTLTLIQRNSDASGAPRRADFRAPGGTLGRDPANHLVLPDESGMLCRVQAALRVDPYACRLRNLSSMSKVSVNDVPLAAGQELSIAPGDTLRIGSYVLGVELSQAAAAPAAEASSAPPLGPVAAAPVAAPVAVPVAAPAPAAAAPRPPEPRAAEPYPAEPRRAETSPHPAEPPYAPEAPRAPVAAQPVSATASRQPEAPIATPPAAAAAPMPMAPPDFPDLSDFDALGKPPAGDPDPLLAGAPAAPLAAEPAPAPQQPPEDVFSGLFGPGTLPVGTVSDVSAHPFEMDSAQARNAADPLSHLPRGDASVSRPQRDPLAMFDAPHGGHDVFADQTPSTLPAHDPLQPMRSDPVRDTLQRPRDTDDRISARDHASMGGSFLRPASPRAPARPGTDRSGNDRDRNNER